MRYVLASLMTFALLFASPGCAAQAKHMESREHRGGPGYRQMPESFYENGKAVVTVRKIGVGIGSGAVLERDGLIITNWHVVKKGDDEKKKPRFEVCQIVKEVEVCSPAKVVHEDQTLDLALLKTKRFFPHAIELAVGDDIKLFDFVYAWANVSVLLPPSPFRGRYVNRITPKRFLQAKRVMLVFDISTNPGGSGSPIFDRRGKCVGITLGVTSLGGVPLTVAVPNTDVRKFIEKYQAKVKKRKRKRPRR